MCRFLRLFSVFFIFLLFSTHLESQEAVKKTSRKKVSDFAAQSAFTQKKFTEEILKYNLRTTVEAYKNAGFRNEKWDNDALDLLEKAALSFSSVPNAPKRQDLFAKSTNLMNIGCNDPLVTYIHAMILYLDGNYKDAYDYNLKAIESYTAGKYPKCRSRHAPRMMFQLCNALGNIKQEETEKWRALAIEWLCASLTDGGYADKEQRIFLFHFYSDWENIFKDKKDECYEAIKKIQNIDPYILKVTGGIYHIAKAWDERGSSWASEVTEKGWKGFEEHLIKARKLLNEAWLLHPEYPEAATHMITVTLGDYGFPGITTRNWFERAIKAQFDYKEAYNAYRQDLMPRWHGSHEEMLTFGIECLDSNRFDTDVPWEFYKTITAITTDLKDAKDYWLKPGIYEKFEPMIKKYLSTMPENSKWHKSVWATVAWQCNKYEKADSLLKELGNDLVEQAFKNIKTTSEEVRKDIEKHK